MLFLKKHHLLTINFIQFLKIIHNSLIPHTEGNITDKKQAIWGRYLDGSAEKRAIHADILSCHKHDGFSLRTDAHFLLHGETDLLPRIW